MGINIEEINDNNFIKQKDIEYLLDHETSTTTILQYTGTNSIFEIPSQIEHNNKYGIIPQTIKKPIENNLLSLVASYRDLEDIVAEEMVDLGIEKKDLPKLIDKLEKDMHKAAKILDFERAAQIRDQLKKLREMKN